MSVHGTAREAVARTSDLRAPARARTSAYTLSGIPVTFDLSCGFLAALATWTFADVLLPAAAPGRSAAAYWTGAFAATLLALMSIVVHELGHAVAARRAGLGVRRMALSLFGGATELVGGPRTPGAACAIAAAGPLASAVLAVAAAVAHVVLVETDADPLAAAIPALGAVANLAIATLNLLPGLPLDGGRILGAVAWRLTGRAAEGARIAAGVGRALGLVIGALAIIASASGDGGVALWFALIGIVIWCHADAADVAGGTPALPDGGEDHARERVGAVRRGRRSTRAA